MNRLLVIAVCSVASVACESTSENPGGSSGGSGGKSATGGSWTGKGGTGGTGANGGSGGISGSGTGGGSGGTAPGGSGGIGGGVGGSGGVAGSPSSGGTSTTGGTSGSGGIGGTISQGGTGGCTPKQVCASNECGDVPDGCGSTINCLPCVAPAGCVNNACEVLLFAACNTSCPGAFPNEVTTVNNSSACGCAGGVDRVCSKLSTAYTSVSQCPVNSLVAYPVSPCGGGVTYVCVPP